VCCAIGYFKPVAGFAIFLLFNTGLGGAFDKYGITTIELGPLQPGTLAYAMAIITLLQKKRVVSNKINIINYILVLLFIFTGIILLSRIIELGTFLTTKILWQMMECLLWAPLYMAFQRMHTVQFNQCKKIVIIFSTITAGISLLISVTGSHYLYDIFSTRSEDLTQKTFMSARIIVHGLWLIVPMGMWFCLMEQFKQHKKNNFIIYSVMAIIIASSIIVNLTRFMLFGLVTNVVFIILASLFLIPTLISKRILKFALFLIILSTITVFSSDDIRLGWIGRYEESVEGGSIEGRIIRNEYLISRLTNELPLFGNKDYWSQEAERSFIVGDPHTVLTVWTSYGLIAALTFAALIIVVFIKLLQFYMSRKQYIQKSAYDWVFLCAMYIQFHWMMVAGDYLFTVTAFVFVLFLANIDRIYMREALCTLN